MYIDNSTAVVNVFTGYLVKRDLHPYILDSNFTHVCKYTLIEFSCDNAG